MLIVYYNRLCAKSNHPFLWRAKTSRDGRSHLRAEDFYDIIPKEVKQLTTMDLVFVFALVWLIVRAVRSIAAGRRVTLAARMPGRIGADLFVVIVFVLAVYLRRAMLSAPFLLLAGLSLYVLLSSLVKTGLYDEGLIHNGKTVPFSAMRGFLIERENDKGVLVRIHTATKDYGLQVPCGEKEQFLARMAAANIKQDKADDGAAQEEA